jgi:hypothetical protein
VAEIGSFVTGGGPETICVEKDLFPPFVKRAPLTGGARPAKSAKGPAAAKPCPN